MTMNEKCYFPANFPPALYISLATCAFDGINMYI